MDIRKLNRGYQQHGLDCGHRMSLAVLKVWAMGGDGLRLNLIVKIFALPLSYRPRTKQSLVGIEPTTQNRRYEVAISYGTSTFGSEKINSVGLIFSPSRMV